MGSLRDQLKKAKLISKKDARRLAHEDRVHRKNVGREGIEKESTERQRELERLREEERAHSRERQAEIDARREADAERAACEDILTRRARPPAHGGGASWFFEVEDGSLPYLRLTDADRHSLLGGHLCVVRTGVGGAHVYRLLDADLARRVAKTLPDRVVWAQPSALSDAG